MSQEVTKLSAESTKRVHEILRNARKELGMLMLKTYAIGAGAAMFLGSVTLAFKLFETPFPTFAGLGTALLIYYRYAMPRSRGIGEKYAKQVKEVLEEERKRQSEEG